MAISVKNFTGVGQGLAPAANAGRFIPVPFGQANPDPTQIIGFYLLYRRNIGGSKPPPYAYAKL